MLVRYDKKVDALSIVFRETTVTTRELGEGIAADFDAEGKLAGLEVLDAAKRMGSLAPLQQVNTEGIGTRAA
jgi:uncharacterized protein YuzE